MICSGLLTYPTDTGKDRKFHRPKSAQGQKGGVDPLPATIGLPQTTDEVDGSRSRHLGAKV